MKSSKAARNERNHRKAVMGHFGGMMNNEIENSTLDRLFDDVVHRNIMENPQPDVEDYDSDDSFPMVLFPRQENHVTSFSEPIMMVPEMRKERSSNQKELTKAERIATISAMVDELNLIIEKEAIWAQDQDIKTVSLLPQSSVSQIVYTSEIITKIFGDMNQTEPNIPATLTMVGLMMYGSIAPELLQVGPLFKPNRFDPTHMVYPHNPYYGDLSCHSIIPRQLDVRPVFEVPVDDDNEVQHCQWDQCHKTLRGLNTLVDHLIKEHVNYVINWTCKWRLCKRTKPFNAHYKLVIHLRRHTGERPHLCYYSNCKKRYARLENLKTHIRTHTGERPYGCEYAGCPKLFSNASDRAKHLSRTHSKVKSFMCIVVNCTKSYTDPSSLRKHIRTQHGNRCYDLTRLAKAQTHQDGLAYRILIQERVTDSSTSMQLMTVEELIARGILQPDMSSSNDENAFNENIDIDGFP